MLNPRSPLVGLCAELCILSYLDFSSGFFARRISALGITDIFTLEKAGVEVFCATTEERVYVCFRGTDSTNDWIGNAMAGKTPYSRGRVHTGFLRSLEVINFELFEYVAHRVSRHQRSLVVTGHSLGGGMAVLYAMGVMAEHVASVVTFGCPRVGDEAFARAFNEQHAQNSVRFVNNNDAVPRIPYKWMGYSHVFRQQKFDRRGRLLLDYRQKPFAKLWDHLAGRARGWVRLKFGDGITDHSMADYARLVDQNLERGV